MADQRNSKARNAASDICGSGLKAYSIPTQELSVVVGQEGSNATRALDLNSHLMPATKRRQEK